MNAASLDWTAMVWRDKVCYRNRPCVVVGNGDNRPNSRVAQSDRLSKTVTCTVYQIELERLCLMLDDRKSDSTTTTSRSL